MMGRPEILAGAWLVALCAGAGWARLQAGEMPPDAAAVHAILHAHCAECHGGHLENPKGGFGHVLDLPRLVSGDKVIPGKPEESDLYLSLIAGPDDFLEPMPPPGSAAPALSQAQIDTIAAWIRAGAVAGPDTPLPGGHGKASPARGRLAPPLTILGRLHPLVVHFPVALLVMAFLFEVLAHLRGEKAPGAPHAAWYCLVAGALLGVMAVATGWVHAGREGHGDSVFLHRMLGLATTAAACLLAGFRARLRGPGPRPALRWVLLLGVLAGLVGATGHSGGAITFFEGFPFFLPAVP